MEIESARQTASCAACGHSSKIRLDHWWQRVDRWYLQRVWRQPPGCPATLGCGETGSGLPEPCSCVALFHVAGT